MAPENSIFPSNDLDQLLSVLKVPALRTITLDSMSIGHDFVEGLKSCKQLEALNLENCDADEFLAPFLDFVQFNESLPSLETLYIFVDPGSATQRAPSRRFWQRFAAIRPNVITEKRDIWTVNEVSDLFAMAQDLYP
jgi:hypothetical protein